MSIAIVSGASSGMGKEFIFQIDGQGWADEIWGIARSAEQLEAVARQTKTPMIPVICDLTNADDIKLFENRLRTQNKSVRMLVNCAGYAKFGSYSDIPVETALNMIDLDVKAVVWLSRLVIPYMPQGGMMIDIASTAAFQPLPYMNIYAASKAFVLSYARALNDELQQRAVGVTAVCPGWTKTNFFSVAEQDVSDKAVRNFLFMSTPRQVVKCALRAAERHRELCIPGVLNKFHYFFSRILPTSSVMLFWNSMRG